MSSHGRTGRMTTCRHESAASDAAEADRNRRNAYYPPHTHSGVTTHLLLIGDFTVLYPDDKEPKKETFGPGARIDVDANRRHEVWMGKEGCTYVIGE